MPHLFLVRHGQSRWNLDNKFTGWVDVPLSKQGISEARKTAAKLKNVSIDVAFTSKLVRAQETLLIILAHQKKCGIFLHESKKRKEWSEHIVKNEIPIHSSDKINERYYGDLQGMNKNTARRKFGKKQVHIWRRGYAIRPPNGESLKDVYKRAVPYFKKNIVPELQKGKDVLVAAHGNSLRAIIKYIESISDENIPNLELGLATPIIYDFKKGKLLRDKHFTFNRPMQ